jgi:hypothetical protein
MLRFLLGRTELQVPDGYSLKLAVIAGPPEVPDQGYRKNVVIAEEALGDLLPEEWLERQLETMKREMEGFQLIHRGTLGVSVAGNPVPLLEIRSTGLRGLVFSGLFAFVATEDTVTSLSCAHFTGPSFVEARPEVLRRRESAARSLAPRPMKKLSLDAPNTAHRTVQTTVEELKPAKDLTAAADRQDPTVSKPPRRAPLISLFGVELDVGVLKDKIRKGLATIGDSAVISLIINVTGSAFTYYAMGVPFDLTIAAAYMVIGTGIGVAYFPVKQALKGLLGDKASGGSSVPET